MGYLNMERDMVRQDSEDMTGQDISKLRSEIFRQHVNVCMKITAEMQYSPH